MTTYSDKDNLTPIIMQNSHNMIHISMQTYHLFIICIYVYVLINLLYSQNLDTPLYMARVALGRNKLN